MSHKDTEKHKSLNRKKQKEKENFQLFLETAN